MLAAFVRWLIRVFPILSYDYRHRRIKRRQFCLNCLNKVKVTASLDTRTGDTVVQCPFCMACWAYNPVVKRELWAKLPKVEE